MSDDTQAAEAPTFSAEALEEWADHVESILRGIAHALNNRAAALSAVIELSRDPDDDPEVTRSILGTELQRVQDLVKVVRAIGTPRGGTEAVAPRDLVPEVLAVLALHADQRERVFSIDASSAPPARVERWMLVRALIAMAATAPTDSRQGRSVGLTLTEDGEWLVTRGTAAGVSLRDSRYAMELVRAMGGEPLPEGDGFRIPSLAAVRRREGR